MAGLGRRTFAAGEVLTAANVMGYLQDQAVMTFAGTAARGSAIASPSEGMTTYRSDADIIEVYNGSAWKQVAKTTGSVLQVVSANLNTLVQVTSTSYAEVSGFTATITPTSATSKFLIICKLGSVGHTDSNNGAFMKLYRGNTSLDDSTSFIYTASGNPGIPATLSYLDSPNTTSAIDYKLRVQSAAGTVRINGIGQNTNLFSASSYTVLEIAG